MTDLWVLWWRYTDGSAAGVVRAYADEARALLDMALLMGEVSCKSYEIARVPVLESPASTPSAAPSLTTLTT